LRLGIKEMFCHFAYSYFKESAGLVSDAFIEWNEIVKSEIVSTKKPEKINVQIEIPVR